MRGPISLTGFASEAPILGRLDGLFAAVSPQIVIPANSLAPGWPEEDGEPLALRTELAARQAEGESTDPVWRAVVMLTRSDGEAAVWRLIALGLGLHGLKAIEARYRARDLDERRDINGELVEGFLSALPRINVDRPHVGRRLLDAAKRQLKKGRAIRYRDIPAELAWLSQPDAGIRGPDSWTEALFDLADEVAAAGHPLDPLALELIGRTVIDRQPLARAAAELGLSVEAAYKRRSRAEERIAATYGIRVRRPASGRSTGRSRPQARDAREGAV